jgi:hypothetical protein
MTAAHLREQGCVVQANSETQQLTQSRGWLLQLQLLLLLVRALTWCKDCPSACVQQQHHHQQQQPAGRPGVHAGCSRAASAQLNALTAVDPCLETRNRW